MVNVVE
jgi:hypothetical protein